MNCSQCNKDLITADPHYLEDGTPSFGFPITVPAGIIYAAPKYWIEANGARTVFCSPHCSTEWHKVQSAKS